MLDKYLLSEFQTLHFLFLIHLCNGAISSQTNDLKNAKLSPDLNPEYVKNYCSSIRMTQTSQ